MLDTPWKGAIYLGYRVVRWGYPKDLILQMDMACNSNEEQE
jgi:hypothetical protein